MCHLNKLRPLHLLILLIMLSFLGLDEKEKLELDPIVNIKEVEEQSKNSVTYTQLSVM